MQMFKKLFGLETTVLILISLLNFGGRDICADCVEYDWNCQGGRCFDFDRATRQVLVSLVPWLC